MKRITVMTPCYNEAGNVTEVAARVRAVFESLPGYEREHLFIDNASTDGTVAELRTLAATDPRVKVILNTRNFGHVRSPHHALLQADGDAVVVLVADLQDPPEAIPDLVRLWEGGAKVVLGVKERTEDSWVMAVARGAYYRLLARLSDVSVVRDATGFGLYDRRVLDEVRRLDDPYPYGRGLVAELGFEVATLPYAQKARRRGLTKNNFLTLYDLALTGITSHSRWPLRIATLGGFVLSVLSFLVALGYLAYKLLYWDRFQAGMAPLVIGLFMAFSLQLFFLGILGEYVAVIHTRLLKRPLVVEKERINF